MTYEDFHKLIKESLLTEKQAQWSERHPDQLFVPQFLGGSTFPPNPEYEHFPAEPGQKTDLSDSSCTTTGLRI